MYAINLDYTVDLAKKDTQVKELDRPLFFGDQNAYMLNVTVKRNNNYENLSGMTCHAYMVYEGTTTTYPLEDAGVSGSTAWAVFDEDSLLTTGRAYILVRLVDEANHFALTVFTLYGDVKLGITNTIFVPEGGILDIDALEEKIAELEGYIDEVGDIVDEAENVDISMTKSGNTITITTTNRNGQQTVNTVEDPSYEVKQKADIDAVTSPSSRKGNPIELTDAVQAPLDTLKITLEPQQDFHGYEKPWVGGCGKNLIDANTVWADFLQSDGTFLNPLGTTHWNIPSNLVNQQLTISAYAKADANNANLRVCAVVGGTNNNGTLVNNTSAFALTQLTFTPTSTDDYVLLQNSGTNGTYKDIQLEIGSTATTYAPYSNICPITGYDSVDAVGTGKNLLHGWDQIGTTVKSKLIPVYFENGESYVASVASNLSSTPKLMFWFYNERKEYVGRSAGSATWPRVVQPNSAISSDGSGTVLENRVKYIQLTIYENLPSPVTAQALDGMFQFERGVTPTQYEAPNYSEVSVSLTSVSGSTVYGGTVTINRDGTGTLVVDKGIETITGESNLGTATTNEVFYLNKSIPMIKVLDYSKHIICDRCETRVSHGVMVNRYGRVPGVTGYADSNNSFPNQNWIYLTNGTATSKTEMSAWLSDNPLTVVYTLATPQSYSLTAVQLQTLLGYNRITTDGTALDVTYRVNKYMPNDTLFNQLPTGTASGDLAAFSDGADDLPLKKLTVDIQPKQDLHGYDKPWAGGAGKNKFQPDNYSGNGITINYSNNVCIINGTATANAIHIVTLNNPLTAGQYTLSASNPIANSNVLLRASTSAGSAIELPLDSINKSATFTANDEIVTVTIRVASGTTLSNFVVYPQLETGSVATTYEPYSNICPISGWDEVKATRVGKNLLEGIYRGGISNTTGQDETETNGVSDYIVVSSQTSYTLSGSTIGSNIVRYFEYDKYKNFIGTNTASASNNAVTITAGSNTRYLRIKASITVLVPGGVYMLEKGSTATAYESYTAKTLSVNLKDVTGSTVYGGTMTVERDGSGTLVVDRAFENAKNLTWVTSLTANAFVATDGFKVPPEPHPASEAFVGSSSYGYDNKSYNQLWGGDNAGMAWRSPGSANTQRGIAMRDPKFADLWASFDLTAFQQAVADLDICYEIAPITYSLTSDQVKTLLGNNTIWADCGAVTAVYYRDITKFIESLLARIEALEG